MQRVTPVNKLMSLALHNVLKNTDFSPSRALTLLPSHEEIKFEQSFKRTLEALPRLGEIGGDR